MGEGFRPDPTTSELDVEESEATTFLLAVLLVEFFAHLVEGGSSGRVELRSFTSADGKASANTVGAAWTVHESVGLKVRLHLLRLGRSRRPSPAGTRRRRTELRLAEIPPSRVHGK